MLFDVAVAKAELAAAVEGAEAALRSGIARCKRSTFSRSSSCPTTSCSAKVPAAVKEKSEYERRDQFRDVDRDVDSICKGETERR